MAGPTTCSPQQSPLLKCKPVTVFLSKTSGKCCELVLSTPVVYSATELLSDEDEATKRDAKGEVDNDTPLLPVATNVDESLVVQALLHITSPIATNSCQSGTSGPQ